MPEDVPLVKRLGKKASNARYLPLLAGPRQRVAYYGWLGYENVGDEAMFEACRAALPQTPVTAMPRGRVHDLLMKSAWRPLTQVAALGGGTLIGHRDYRLPIEATLAKFPEVPAFSLGSGVEDPVLDRSRTPAPERRAELERWQTLLARFERVGVRGPRSAALLADVGVDAEITGDIALLLDSGVDIQPEQGTVGINLGVAGSQWGQDPSRVEDEYVELLRILHAGGHKIRLISMWSEDDQLLQRVQQRAGVSSEIVLEHTTSGVIEGLRTCETFVGLKLHSVILASALSIPAVMIEYQPKCADFMDSLDRSDYNVRTDEFRGADVSERIAAMTADVSVERVAVRSAADELRARLRSLIADVEAAALR